MKKIIIIISLIYIFLIFRGGFYPLEHNIIIRNATKYVIEKYNIVPAEVRITTLYLWFPVTVRITTEDGFWFTLRTGRFFYKTRHFTDDYLRRMTQEILQRELRNYVNEVTDGKASAIVSLFTSLLVRTSWDEATALIEIKNNPNIVFEKLYSGYFCSVTFYDDITQNNYNIDYYLIFDIYNRIFEFGLSPRSISFSFKDPYEQDWSISLLRVRINQEQFADINSSDDLRILFEEAIQIIR